jgi:hypothetical protein
MANIRAEPKTPVETINFNYQTSRDDYPECRLYYTPTPSSTSPSLITRILNNPLTHPKDKAAILPKPDIVFTHGRSENLDATALEAFTKGFARTQTCLSFLDPGTLEHRTLTFHSLLSFFPTTSLGGRSDGARSACRAAIWSPIRKLIFFTYPLIRDTEARYEELLQLASDVDVLFIVGDSDHLCTELPLSAIRRRMRARTWWIRVKGADHGFLMKGDVEAQQGLCGAAGQLAARWNVDGGRDPGRTEMTLQWDEERKEAVWTGWMVDPKREGNVKAQGEKFPDIWTNCPYLMSMSER